MKGPTEGRTVLIRNSKTITGRLHDELVMMDPGQGKYFSLSPLATRVWDLLEEPLDISGLCRILCEEYDVDPEQCYGDVSEYIEEMIELGLLLKGR